MQKPQKGILRCTSANCIDIYCSVHGGQYAAGVGTVDLDPTLSKELKMVPLQDMGLKNDKTATMTVTEVAKNHHPQLDLEEISMTQPSLSVSDEDEDIQLNNNREEDEDDDEDLSYLNPMEREFIQIMRSERILDLLRSKSSKFIYKFSIIFPAHIVATVMCTWFILAFLIVALSVEDNHEKMFDLEKRIKVLEAWNTTLPRR